jgi:hypothetical protein
MPAPDPERRPRRDGSNRDPEEEGSAARPLQPATPKSRDPAEEGSAARPER